MLVRIDKDYDLEVHYHPGKANVVADALSRKSQCHCLSVESFNETLCQEMMKLNLEMLPQGSLNHIDVEPTLHDSIIMCNIPKIYQIKSDAKNNFQNSFRH